MSDEDSKRRDFYRLATAVGNVEKKHLEFGSHGLGGGVDGTMVSSKFFQVINAISTDFLIDDPLAYGCDVGHGTGFAAMAYFNYGLGLNMIGIEFNRHRAFCSWILQRELLLHTRSDFREIAKKSQFYLGEGAAGLTEIFGSTGELKHLKLIYWFSEGWNPDDIKAVIDYANLRMKNLQWLLCDLTEDELAAYGFQGKILSSSKWTGRLKQSTNSRTIRVYRVRMPSNVDIALLSEKERLVLDKFDTNDVALLGSLNQELLKHTSLLDPSQRVGRGTREIPTDGHVTEPLTIEPSFSALPKTMTKRKAVKSKKSPQADTGVETVEAETTAAYLRRLLTDISLGSKILDPSTASKTALIADKREKKRKLDFLLSERFKLFKFRKVPFSP